MAIRCSDGKSIGREHTNASCADAARRTGNECYASHGGYPNFAAAPLRIFTLSIASQQGDNLEFRNSPLRVDPLLDARKPICELLGDISFFGRELCGGFCWPQR